MTVYNHLTDEDGRLICQIIEQGDYLLIGAGRGLSAAAGLDYNDDLIFSKKCPLLANIGLKNLNECLSPKGRSPLVFWGQAMTAVWQMRFSGASNKVYEHVLELAKDKHYFVITTNVDGQFYPNGVDSHRIYTPSGDYNRLQCEANCANHTWATAPYLKKILANLEPNTLALTNPNLIPRCPDCGGAMIFNTLDAPRFCHSPYDEQAKRYYSFINGSTQGKLVILELGVGYTNPNLVRFPFEHILDNHPQGTLIRLNTLHPLAVVENAHKTHSISLDLGETLAFLTAPKKP